MTGSAHRPSSRRSSGWCSTTSSSTSRSGSSRRSAGRRTGSAARRSTLLLLGSPSCRGMRRGHAARAPLFVLTLLTACLQAKTVEWLPSVPYLYAFVFSVVGVLLLRQSVAAATAHARRLSSRASGSFAWRYTEVPAAKLRQRRHDLGGARHAVPGPHGRGRARVPDRAARARGAEAADGDPDRARSREDQLLHERLARAADAAHAHPRSARGAALRAREPIGPEAARRPRAHAPERVSGCSGTSTRSSTSRASTRSTSSSGSRTPTSSSSSARSSRAAARSPRRSTSRCTSRRTGACPSSRSTATSSRRSRSTCSRTPSASPTGPRSASRLVRCAAASADGRFLCAVEDTGDRHPRGPARARCSIASTRCRARRGAGPRAAPASASRSCRSSPSFHMGSITVRSRVGEGSTFTVELPVERSAYPPDRLDRRHGAGADLRRPPPPRAAAASSSSCSRRQSPAAARAAHPLAGRVARRRGGRSRSCSLVDDNHEMLDFVSRQLVGRVPHPDGRARARRRAGSPRSRSACAGGDRTS